jgi:tRNA-guanine family transglycosylase
VFLFVLLQVCKNYTRAYIHCLVTKDAMGSQLLSYHNLYYMMQVQIISCDKMIYYKYGYPIPINVYD